MFSWALILQKLRLFSRLERQTTQFLRMFRATKALPEPKAVSGLGSPLESLYAAGHRELASQLSNSNPHSRVKSLQAVTTDMQMAASEEIRKIEKYMPWLATTGSITPFIGLFGTVWGVMDAFSGLGEAGAASLRAVAPGIAEALVTTAAGLFTAIPAVMAYNHFLHHIKQFAARMDNFTMEVAALIEKQYL
jgi:biopolymer transport protein TolQ